MRPIIILIVCYFLKEPLFADCAGTGLWVFPTGPTLKLNSLIILEGYAESQHIIHGLNTKHNIYLLAGKTKVKLKVKEICTGQFYLTQAILSPEEKLEPGKEYELHIDSLPSYESLGKYNYNTHVFEPIKWKVTQGIDMDKPVIKLQPKELTKTYKHLGCGPVIYITFSYEVEDSSEIVVKTTLRNIKLNTFSTYYVTANKTKVDIGHGMCSGAFQFTEDYYEAEFLYMDASGNITPAKEKIRFIPPKEETEINNHGKIIFPPVHCYLKRHPGEYKLKFMQSGISELNIKH